MVLGEEEVREQRSCGPALQPQSEGRADSALDLPAGPSAGREQRPSGGQQGGGGGDSWW